MSRVVPATYDDACRLCGRTEADVHLITVHLVNVIPARRSFVCEPCLHEIEARHRATTARS